jgi:hypothetical protein
MFKGDLTDTVSKAFKQVYGKPCWGVEYDRNVNLSMSFGDQQGGIQVTGGR